MIATDTRVRTWAIAWLPGLIKRAIRVPLRAHTRPSRASLYLLCSLASEFRAELSQMKLVSSLDAVCSSMLPCLSCSRLRCISPAQAKTALWSLVGEESLAASVLQLYWKKKHTADLLERRKEEERATKQKKKDAIKQRAEEEKEKALEEAQEAIQLAAAEEAAAVNSISEPEVIDRSRIERNINGSEEPSSARPELWNIDNTEVDMLVKYKTGGQMWYVQSRMRENPPNGKPIPGYPMNKKAVDAKRHYAADGEGEFNADSTNFGDAKYWRSIEVANPPQKKARENVQGGKAVSARDLAMGNGADDDNEEGEEEEESENEEPPPNAFEKRQDLIMRFQRSQATEDWQKMEGSNESVTEDALRIWVGLGRGLANADKNGKSDPYCVVKMANIEVFRTEIIDDTLDPCWNTSFLVPMKRVDNLMRKLAQKKQSKATLESLRSKVHPFNRVLCLACRYPADCVMCLRR